MSADDELRDLQRRAYGRDAVLTRGEAARLRELQNVRTSASDVSGPGPEPQAEPAPAPPGEAAPPVQPERSLAQTLGFESPDGDGADEPPLSAQPDEVIEERVDARSGHGIRSVLRRHWRGVAVASVVLLALGVGVGWALFAPHADAIPLTAAEQDRRPVLEEEGDYDPGTLRAIAKEDDVIVWYGTKDEGDLECLTIESGDLADTQCALPDDDVETVLTASLFFPPESGDDDRGADLTSVNAYVMFSTTGEPMVSISRWSETRSLTNLFSGDDRVRAEELVDEGFLLNLSMIGEFRQQPVWLAQRWTDVGDVESCLIVDGADRQQECLSQQEASESGIGVQVVETDEDGSVRGVWLVMLEYARGQTPYLTISEAGGA